MKEIVHLFEPFDEHEAYTGTVEPQLKQKTISTKFGDLEFASVVIANPEHRLPDLHPDCNVLFVFANTIGNFNRYDRLYPDVLHIERKFVVT